MTSLLTRSPRQISLISRRISPFVLSSRNAETRVQGRAMVFSTLDRFSSHPLVANASLGEGPVKHLPSCRTLPVIGTGTSRGLSAEATQDRLYNVTSEEDDDGTGVWIVANTNLVPGEVLFTSMGDILSAPTMHSIQVSDDRHLICKGDIVLANHSCDPNCRLVMETEESSFPHAKLVVVKEITAGERITFDYNSTEWDMATPFKCVCGARRCQGMIQGFAHLPKDVQEEYVSIPPTLGPASQYIKSRYTLEVKTAV